MLRRQQTAVSENSHGLLGAPNPSPLRALRMEGQGVRHRGAPAEGRGRGAHSHPVPVAEVLQPPDAPPTQALLLHHSPTPRHGQASMGGGNEEANAMEEEASGNASGPLPSSDGHGVSHALHLCAVPEHVAPCSASRASFSLLLKQMQAAGGVPETARPPQGNSTAQGLEITPNAAPNFLPLRAFRAPNPLQRHALSKPIAPPPRQTRRAPPLLLRYVRQPGAGAEGENWQAQCPLAASLTSRCRFDSGVRPASQDELTKPPKTGGRGSGGSSSAGPTGCNPLAPGGRCGRARAQQHPLAIPSLRLSACS